MQPYKSKEVLIKVDSTIVGVVEGLFSEGIKLGGVEPNYKSNVGRHVRGGVVVPFNLRRWMYIDPNKKRLLYDLWKNKTEFTLFFGLHSDGDYTTYDTTSIIQLTNCKVYKWRPITGAANDIIAEEIVGEALNIAWVSPCPCEDTDEIIANGGFETGDETGWIFDGAVSVSTTGERTGSYCASYTDVGSILQTLSSEMPYGCITSFSLWFRRYGGNPCGYPSANYKITVTYTDATTTIITGQVSSSTFAELDIHAQLESTKTVASVKIECTGVNDNALMKVDDVSLVCSGGYY